MTLKRIFRRHLPLITPRIGFEVQPLPPPPPITLRMNLAEKIKPPTGRSPDATGRLSTSKATRSATKKVEATKRRDPTPRAKTPRDPTLRAKTPVPAIASDSDLSDLELEPDSGLGKLASDPKQPSTSRKAKIKKPLGEPGRPHSGGFSLEGALEALGWSKDDFDSFRVRFCLQFGLRMFTICSRSAQMIWLRKFLMIKNPLRNKRVIS